MSSLRIPPLRSSCRSVYFLRRFGARLYTSGDFEVVYHRRTAVSDAPENSLMGLQCVVENCGSADCPARLRVMFASCELKMDPQRLKAVWIHDGTTALPAVLMAALSFPALLHCTRMATGLPLAPFDGTVTENEKIPTLDEVLEQLQELR